MADDDQGQSVTQHKHHSGNWAAKNDSVLRDLQDQRDRVADHIVERDQRGDYAYEEVLTPIQEFPDVGKFVIPSEDTWSAHTLLVKNPANALRFDTQAFPHFDRIIADKFGPALYDPSHKDYLQYEGLRTNLAVMRNDIIGWYVDDGSFDPDDMKYIPNIRGIAETLGTALANDSWYGRALGSSMSIDVASVEGVGAAQMYKYLLSQQDKPAIAQALVDRMKLSFGIPNRNWGLPPIEETPYSDTGLSAPGPSAGASPPKAPASALPADFQKMRDALNVTMATGPLPLPPAPPPAANDNDERLINACENLCNTAQNFGRVEMMSDPSKSESVDEARKILRYLRNLEGADKDLESFVGKGSKEAKVAKVEAMQRLVRVFATQAKQAIKSRPQTANDPVVANARDTALAIALVLTEYTRNLLAATHETQSRHLQDLADALPEAAELRADMPVVQLLETLELGIERVSGREVSDLTLAERLSEMHARTMANTQQLAHLETLQAPSREESVELARDLLRKLKELSKPQQKLTDVVEKARPEEKLAFASQVDQMAKSYVHIVQEAAHNNPQILQDPQLKNANDAVGKFVHAVSLMAAKEIPSSLVAASQQISADITQQPENWHKLEGQTVERLVDTAEEGLEQAVDELAMDQEEKQQDEELAQEAIEAALNTHTGKRKRKRRGSQRSGAGGKKQRKKMLDLTADDYMLKQGRFAQENNLGRGDTAMAMLKGLNPADLANIRALGDSLRDMGGQGQSLNVGSTVAPDDKTATQRAIEEHTKPKGPRNTGPRT